MTAQDRITEWAALAENATCGPWRTSCGVSWEARVLTGTMSLADTYRMKDATLMAASRTAVPAMAAALTAVLERHRHAAPEYPNECADGCQWPCPTVAAVEAALAATA